jgi:hypothetical protein
VQRSAKCRKHNALYERISAQLCILQKGCTRLAPASDKVYPLLAQDRWFSPSTPVSSTTKTFRHAIAEILLKVALVFNNYVQALYFNIVHNKRIMISELSIDSSQSDIVYSIIHLRPFSFSLLKVELQSMDLVWFQRICLFARGKV